MTARIDDARLAAIDADQHTYTRGHLATVVADLVDDLRDARAALASMERERDEAQRKAYGTPCDCESWISTCRAAEDALAASQARVAELERIIIERVPQTCDGSGSWDQAHFDDEGRELGMEHVQCLGCSACLLAALSASSPREALREVCERVANDAFDAGCAYITDAKHIGQQDRIDGVLARVLGGEA